MVTSDWMYNMAVLRMHIEKYALYPLLYEQLWLWTWIWSRYHVPQNVFLVVVLIFYLWLWVLCIDVYLLCFQAVQSDGVDDDNYWWRGTYQLLCTFRCIDEWFVVNRTCPEHPGDWSLLLCHVWKPPTVLALHPLIRAAADDLNTSYCTVAGGLDTVWCMAVYCDLVIDVYCV